MFLYRLAFRRNFVDLSLKTRKSYVMQKTSDLIWQDIQHQRLFEIIDSLKDEVDAKEVVLQLHLYMDCHFALEEGYMLQLNYPGYEAHLEAHNKFRIEMSKLLEHGPEGMQEQHLLSSYLRRWLKLHVLGIDKQLEAFILASDEK